MRFLPIGFLTLEVLDPDRLDAPEQFVDSNSIKNVTGATYRPDSALADSVSGNSGTFGAISA